MDVARIMNRDVVRVAPDTALGELIRLQASPVARQLYVTEQNGHLLGIVTSFDLLKRFVPEYLDSNLSKLIVAADEFLADTFDANRTVLAREIMTRDFESLQLGASVLDADAIMVHRRFNAMPVLDAQGTLLGEVSRKDILSHIVRIARLAE